MLPKPISVKPNEEFIIVAAIQGPRSHRGENGKTSVNINGTVVTFQDTNLDSDGLSSNGTNNTRDQFYKVFLSNC